MYVIKIYILQNLLKLSTIMNFTVSTNSRKYSTQFNTRAILNYNTFLLYFPPVDLKSKFFKIFF